MLKRALLLQLMLLVGYSIAFSQPKPETYQPIVSSGQIPADMLIKSSKKYEVEKSTISQNESKKDRKSIESFYLSTNFEIDKLLQSGMVSFNDPITQYLNKIVDVLLKDEPELRKQIRVYTMKSTVMNAFATNQGIIFVNLGLLARVKSEAELAFVLSHEIIHVQEKHSLNKYLKVQTIDNDEDLYNDLTLDDKLANINHYSRELETEADEMGLKRYLKAGYTLDAIESSFTALSYSHIPFVDHEFEYTFLESPTFSFPEEFWRKKLNTVKPLDDDDTTSTHPSIEQRKSNILAKLEGVSAENRNLAIVSAEEFNTIREFSQFEVCRLHLARQRYDLAIYEAQALLKNYPDNLYLQKVILKALAAKAYIVYDGIRISEWEDYVNEVLEGNVQRCYHFNLCLATDAEYSASIATRYAWQLKQANPQDKEIESIADSMMHLLFYDLEMDPEFFATTPRSQTEADSIALAYDKVNFPEKYQRQDSLSLSRNDSTNRSVVEDSSKLATAGRGPAQTRDSNGNTISEDNSIVSAEDEPIDTFYVSTLSEAKKLKIKMTSYEKYMLKNKDKFDILGIKKDGTFVYKDQKDWQNKAGVWSSTEHDRKIDTAANTSATNDSLNYDDDSISVLVEAILDSINEEYNFYYFARPIDEEFHKYAFVDFADDPAFAKKSKSYFKLKGRDENHVPSNTERKKLQREETLNETRGLALNIKKVVVVNPTYRKINLTSQQKEQYLTSEIKQQKFSNVLKTNAEACGIKYQIIDNKNLNVSDVSTFNDIAFLNQYINERLELGNDVPISTLELSEREAIAKKYGTRYFMWTGNLSVTQKVPYTAALLVYGIVVTPVLPFIITSMIRNGKYQVYYYIVFDIISNQMVLADVIEATQLERRDFLNSHVYNTFNQLNFKR